MDGMAGNWLRSSPERLSSSHVSAGLLARDLTAPIAHSIKDSAMRECSSHLVTDRAVPPRAWRQDLSPGLSERSCARIDFLAACQGRMAQA